MTVICCICQEKIGKRHLSKKKVATSFAWRNHGLCPGCFDRARAGIDRAYNQALPGSGSLRPQPVTDGSTL